MYNKEWIAAIVCLVSLLWAIQTADAASRTALVIGNSNYKAAAPLKNPGNDARDMAEALKDIGFEVICKVDAGREEMDAAVQDFFRNLNRAQAGFFYYAGHGMQINGVNYLLPIDIHVSSAGDVKHRAIKTDWILSKMEDSGSKVNVVVLDACRDNPFRGLRGAGDGLAPIQSVRGSFIAYATSPGSVARDGTGRNGIYTSHLLKNIKRSGLTVEEVFREVRKGVAESTNNEQVPWDSSSLMGAFYMAGTGPGADEADRRRLEQEQARLERERRELERLKAEIEGKSQQVKEKKTDVASVPLKPKPGVSPIAAPEIARDGVYVAYANGIVRDSKTGLEWVAGPDEETTFEEAKSWVQSLTIDGGGWRMPTEAEVNTLYKTGAGLRNMTPLLKTGGWIVWCTETEGSSTAWYFTFLYGGSRGWYGRYGSYGNRAFAVRSRSDG